MSLSEYRKEERRLIRNEDLDKWANKGRALLLTNWDVLPSDVTGLLKLSLSSLADYLTRERANGNLLTRSMSKNGLLTLTSEERRLLSHLGKE